MRQITAHVYIEAAFRGCTVSFVVTSDGVVLVDSPQAPTEAVRWREEIAHHGTPRYLINTEPHGDHITGDAFFDAVVVAHEGTRQAIVATFADLEAFRLRLAQMDPDSASLAADYQPNIPAITFNDRLSLHLGGHTFELLHLPGHTPSQTAVFVPQERVVFTGDNVVYQATPIFGSADVLGWVASLQRLQELDVDTVVPGHGRACGRDYLAEMQVIVEEWIAAVREAIGRGWSQEEAVERVRIEREHPGDVGRGPEAVQRLSRMNVARIYQELTRQT